MTQPPTFDPRRFKQQERKGFNRIAAAYADGAHLRATLAQALLAEAALQPGQRVLDLASGPCLLAREAAAKVAPEGWVLATDIAEAMLAEGARRAQADACNTLVCAAADAEHLCLPDAAFDRVLAGLALFMFPHPERALAEARRVLRPGGRLVLSVWATEKEVPLITRAQACIARLLPAPRVARPSVFRFGTPAVLEAALSDAGFTDIRIMPCRFDCRFDDAQTYWDAFLTLAGGAAEALAQLPEPMQQRLRTAVAEELAPHRNGNGYTVEARALVASAAR
jgi:ubiquinone/menaquinone biosynthesis C-methylase UbiE